MFYEYNELKMGKLLIFFLMLHLNKYVLNKILLQIHRDILTSFLRGLWSPGVNLGTTPTTESPGPAWLWRWWPTTLLRRWDVSQSQDFPLWEWKFINLPTKESGQREILSSSLTLSASCPASVLLHFFFFSARFHLGRKASWSSRRPSILV